MAPRVCSQDACSTQRWAEREGSAWRRDGQKMPHFLFYFGCHLNRCPNDVRTNNRYSRPGGLMEYSFKKYVFGGFARHTNGGVLPHAAATRAQRFLGAEHQAAGGERYMMYRRRGVAGTRVPCGCRLRSFFGAPLFGLSKCNGDAGHHGGREGGVPALRDVLQRPLQRPESVLRGVAA